MSQDLMNAIVNSRTNEALNILHLYRKKKPPCHQFNIDGFFQSKTKGCSRSCLHEACRTGQTDLANELLVCGASANVVTTWKATPLHFAAEAGNLPEVKLLLQHGALILATSIFGRTPCHQAASKGHIKIVKEFLKRGFNVNQQDEKGYTLLHHAAKSGRLNLVKILVEEHSANANIVESTGKTALEVAKDFENWDKSVSMYFSRSVPGYSAVDGGDLPQAQSNLDDLCLFHSGSDETTPKESLLPTALTSASHERIILSGNNEMVDETLCKEVSSSSSNEVSDEAGPSNISKRRAALPIEAHSTIPRWSIEEMFQKVVRIELNQESGDVRLKRLEQTNEEILTLLQFRESQCPKCLLEAQHPADTTGLKSSKYTTEQATVIAQKIKQNLVILINNIRSDDHTDCLLQEDSLTFDELEEIDAEKTIKSKTRKMMHILLKKKDVDWVYGFVKSMKMACAYTSALAEELIQGQV